MTVYPSVDAYVTEICIHTSPSGDIVPSGYSTADIPRSAELTETIRRIRDEFGLTILLVEHDMGLVMNVCDTVCAISFGQMLAIGTTEEIQKNKAVQEAYLGVEGEE